MSPLERLDAAERALSEAREKREQLEAARDRFDDRANALTEEHDAKQAALSDLAVDVEIGTASRESLETARADLARLATELTEALGARDACDQRVIKAERDEAAAERAVRDAAGTVARPVYRALEDEIRETARRLYRLQRLWLEVAQTGGNSTPWSGSIFQMHGAYQSPESIPQIAADEGVDFETMGPRTGAPLPRLSLDTLRRLASDPNDVDREPRPDTWTTSAPARQRAAAPSATMTDDAGEVWNVV